VKNGIVNPPLSSDRLEVKDILNMNTEKVRILYYLSLIQSQSFPFFILCIKIDAIKKELLDPFQFRQLLRDSYHFSIFMLRIC